MKNFNYVSKHTGDIYNLGLSVGKYANGQTSIQLIDIDDGFPYAVATVAVDCELKENEVAIKNYSENEGILKNLVNNDIIENPHRFTSSGFVTIPICFIKNLE
jgi:hypothetical protein